MPVSMLHEALVLLFRNRPILAPEILSDVLKVEVPQYTEARLQEATLNQIVPTEYRADLVVLLLHQAPVFAIVVEVQLGVDEDKPFSWPLYQSALRAKLRCPACVLVVAPDPAIATWAAQAILTGQPGVEFRPLVLGPSGVPVVTDRAQAQRAPELSVLSALAHGSEPSAAEIAEAAIDAAMGLDQERSTLYADLVWSALNEAAKKALEERMAHRPYEYQSEFARRYFAQGRAAGEAEGEAKGKAEAILSVLAARGLKPTRAERDQIVSCTDAATLERWLVGALHAKSVKSVLAPAS
ncbi:MAG: hypothetical protein IT384_05055, partial [Deltaproteobacteria bacterium]|nr:hypothetical protein [Deltaproteobacteria bacterium]